MDTNDGSKLNPTTEALVHLAQLYGEAHAGCLLADEGLNRLEQENFKIRRERDDLSIECDRLRERTSDAETREKNAVARVADHGALKDLIKASMKSNKIPMIKAVRELTGLGLKDSKELVDSACETSGPVRPASSAPSSCTDYEAPHRYTSDDDF